VRIAAFPSAASAFVPLALRELRSAEPTLQPDLHVMEPEEAVDALARGKLDVALTLDSDLLAGPTKPGIDAVLVHDDPMLVALPTDHRLAREATIDLGELRHEEWLMPCVGGTCPDSNIVLRACADAGFEPVVHFESGDYSALTGLAASGLGVALIPSLAAVSSRTDVVIRPVRGTAPTRRVLASYRAPGGDPAVEAVIDALRLAGRRLALQSQTHAIAA
jgi:DNA-binding transcriptional LysR family regulator